MDETPAPSVVPVVFERKQIKRLAHVSTDENDFHAWAYHYSSSLHKYNLAKQKHLMYWIDQDVVEQELPSEEAETIKAKGTPEQKVAWQALCQRNNVCILGPGGTGKSQFIQWVKQLYLEQGLATVTTASTANAAFLLYGVTLHKFAGLPIICCDEGKMNMLEAADKYIKHLSSLYSVVNTILQVQLWICDEISMIAPRVFSLVDVAFRYFRRRFDAPFGGVQFLWSGDFLQIPPVVKQSPGTKRARQDSFLFSHDAWTSAWRPWVVSFTTNKRSSQLEWSLILARMRMGRPSREDLAALHQRTLGELRFRGELEAFMDDIVTHIYPTNADVTRENNLARSRLVGPDHVFLTSFCTTCNVDQEWTEDDSRLYEYWSKTCYACPKEWVPLVVRGQEVLRPESPWYMVLCRSVFLETSLVRNRLVSDDECRAALLAQASKFMQDSRLQPDSRFRVGEKVRLTTNLAQSRGLVNGMTGRVVGFLLNNYNEFEWNACNLRQLKRFMNSIGSEWFVEGDASFAEQDDDYMLDEQDAWTRALNVKCGPRNRSQVDEIWGDRAFLSKPSEEADYSMLSAIGKIRAQWYGSVALDALYEIPEGEFVWTDEPSVEQANGIPVVEWSIGTRTIVPFYNWSLDFSGLMGRDAKKYQPKDRWQIHLFALPIKPAHAMTYHDCQGQTCRKVVLGNVSRLFTHNMLYVGLSRAPSIECVCISDDFSALCVKAHPEAIEFFDSIDAQQAYLPVVEGEPAVPARPAAEEPQTRREAYVKTESYRAKGTYPVFVGRNRYRCERGLDQLLPE